MHRYYREFGEGTVEVVSLQDVFHKKQSVTALTSCSVAECSNYREAVTRKTRLPMVK